MVENFPAKILLDSSYCRLDKYNRTRRSCPDSDMRQVAHILDNHRPPAFQEEVQVHSQVEDNRRVERVQVGSSQDQMGLEPEQEVDNSQDQLGLEQELLVRSTGPK